MATYVPPKINVQLIFYSGLIDQSNTKLLKANPTLASGDFQASTDGGALANLGTLPTVTPASGRMVKFTLSTGEMNGANATVVAVDAAGAEWCDQLINWQTSARQVDDLAYPATTGRSMVVDANGLVDATTVKVGPTGSGTAQTARDVGASVLLSTGSGTGQLDFTSGVVKANATQLLGTAWLTPGTAGTPDVNAKLLGGTAQTGRDVGASVLLSTGTGAGQLDFTSGVVKANLAQILGTALTETAGQIAAAFKQFFNIGSPAATMDHGILVDTVTTYTGNTKQTGDNYPRLGAPAGASIAADIAEIEGETDAIQAQTDKLTFTVANQVDSNVLDWKSATAPAMTGDAFARLGAPTGASIAADIQEIEGETDSIISTLGTPAGASVSVDIAAVQTTATDTQGDVDALETTIGAAGAGLTAVTLGATGSAALTESYAADGANATLVQLLYEIRALLSEFSISGTTLTAKKKDGSTTAATYTLDSATAPTSITRAS